MSWSFAESSVGVRGRCIPSPIAFHFPLAAETQDVDFFNVLYILRNKLFIQR